MGRGIRSSAFAGGGGVALAADGLEFTAGSCQTSQRVRWGQRRASGRRGQRGQHGQRGQRRQHGVGAAPARSCPVRLGAGAGGCPGSLAAAPGHAGGRELARGDTIKDGNLLIQALPALQRESGTVFFTTS